MIIKNTDVSAQHVGTEGVTRKILAAGGKMMAVEVYFPKGARFAPHTHPHEQIGYVVKGEFEITIEEEKTLITVGDTYYIPPDVIHGVVALQESLVLDIFTPQREDFLK